MAAPFHHTPGRLRIRRPDIKHNAAAAGRVQAELQAIPGVTSVETNLITGSLLIRYQAGLSVSSLFFERLTSMGLEGPASQMTNAGFRHSTAATTSGVIAGSLGRKVAKAAAIYILETSVERLVIAVIAGLL